MSKQGIDLSRSGWENPEGFEKQPRPATAAPPVPAVCGDRHPDGWECELRPGHPPDIQHKADDGSQGGVRWDWNDPDGVAGWHSVTEGMTGPESEVIITRPAPGEGRLLDRPQEQREIREIAEKALRSESPAAWVLALDKIRQMVS